MKIPEKCFSTAKEYQCNPAEFVREHVVTINGKKRTLRAYAYGGGGEELRALHTAVAQIISSGYMPSNASVAYKKGDNIVKCVSRHLSGCVFFKSDIVSFFESITLEKFMDRLKDSLLGKNSDLKKLLPACFYENMLPLGFCCSPILSDFYLSDIDKKYENGQGYVYTRYADDFIVSSRVENGEEILKELREKLWDDMESVGLDLNEKKTYIRRLDHDGDHFHALGLNIVRREKGKNIITVGDAYLRETCKQLTAIVGGETNNEEDICAVRGKIEFIRMASQDSYRKFERLVKVKTGSSLQAISEKLSD